MQNFESLRFPDEVECVAADLQKTLDYKKIKKRNKKMDIMIYIGWVVGMALAAAVSFVITYVKKEQGKKTAVEVVETERDDAKAELAVRDEAERLIKEFELDLSDIDTLLHANVANGTAGSMKFRMVLQALDCFCLRNGFKWDVEAMTQLISDKVAFTKAVNYPTTK